ncbi:MAG: glycoside hydrolase family 2 protein, partial [Flaviaesturariibacter sp.]|nr:glycoside hydrolase family 2 protein [Flaviaesturariibacter sp.]
VFLNGKLLFQANNMFRQWKTAIKSLLQSKKNRLRIVFHPSVILAKGKKALEKPAYPETERIYVRKAQYQFGWDWGPRLVTCGIWKDVKLVASDEVQLTGLSYETTNLVSGSSITGAIKMQIWSDEDRTAQLVISNKKGRTLYPPLSQLGQSWNFEDSSLLNIQNFDLKKGSHQYNMPLSGSTYKTWSPGHPYLYQTILEINLPEKQTVVKNLSRSVIIADRIVAEKKINFGITNIQLHTPKDSIGEGFFFTINGKPTFIKGANWIPADAFLPRAKKEDRYRRLIKAAKEANINMLRVWGGGVYEDDIFYDLCDEYGILVWQDFMFAGALYPGDTAFLANVEAEVRYQVNRLKSHPCIALWCGNNEISEAWHNWGWQQQFHYSAADSAKLWNDYQKLFHNIIPKVLAEEDPARPYWPSSPSLGWGRDNAYKKGDVHYWGVWWGKEPIEKYNEKVGRFNSEYGMQGMPGMKTIHQFALPQDLDTASAVMKTHQKHPFGYENIKLYVSNRFRQPKRFEDLVYVSQLMQADAIKTAIEAHRRAAPYNMGTLFWQWNDCWPVTSWSAIDYYGRKKALYYEVKRSFAPVVAVTTYDSASSEIKVYVHNETDARIMVIAGLFPLDSPINMTDNYDGKFFEPGDTGSYVINGAWLGIYKRSAGYNLTIIKNPDRLGFGEFVSEKQVFFAPPKDLELHKPTLLFKMVSASSIEIQTDYFAYGVFIDVPDGVELEDNYFHLLPNEKRIIKYTSRLTPQQIAKSIHITSLADTY